MSNSTSRIIGRMLQWLQFVAEGHIFNPLWHDRQTRRKKRYKATYNACMRYLDRYSDMASRIKPESIDMSPEPERAFTIWFQGEENAPALVKSCFRSMRRHLEQELVILDEKTLFQWISLPDFVIRKWKDGTITHAGFSDICRIELLYEHGGLWFDATDFVTAPVPEDIMNQEAFVFLGGDKVGGYYAGIQSCFMRAKKGNPLYGVWREAIFEYWKEEDSAIDYFWCHLLFCLCTKVNPIAAACFAKMEKRVQDPTHTLWGAHAGDEYDEETFASLTAGSFFQKTNFKDKRLAAIEPGSIAEYVVNC